MANTKTDERTVAAAGERDLRTEYPEMPGLRLKPEQN